MSVTNGISALGSAWRSSTATSPIPWARANWTWSSRRTSSSVLRTKSVNQAYCVIARIDHRQDEVLEVDARAPTARGSDVPPAGSQPSSIENTYSASSPTQNDGAAVLK